VINLFRSREAGRSLIELAIVVMMTGVLTAMSVVIFGNGKARYELTRNAQSLSWQIERTRSLAVKYNQTLALGFQQDGSFGLTCTGCDAAKSELGSITFPPAITFSAHPTLTIRGNGTISGGSGITLTDARGRQILVSIGNSGRVVVGSITAESSS
jgi:Tfp pilus assembly protein FimT